MVDAHRHELGFVRLPSLREQIERGEMLVATLGDEPVGFVDYHRRRDGQITLYHIAVEPAFRAQGVGRVLVAALAQVARDAGCARIALKCPVDLPANAFYREYGFELAETLNGRRRGLNVWVLGIVGEDAV
jgi:GNAT superfamily N-acetyltransferase